MRRRHVRHDRALLAAVALLGVLCVVVLWSRPAPAQPGGGEVDGFVLSTNRVHWTPSLTEALTGPGVVYVRNDGVRSRRMQVSLVLRGRDSSDDSWGVVSTQPEVEDLPLRELALRPGDVRRLELGATVDALSKTATVRELRVDVDVRPAGTGEGLVSASGPTISSEVRSRLGTATVGGLWAFLGLGVVRRRRVEQLA
ncbi:hypothetical protein [Nocardioides halotolerans]|uniref:hypothetical protein n=1 Tax=Nocardioides halotolerans TaxID=433660 RepID=UPI0004031E5A|nr:hypothetical protein [Nocardioides halotolerans]